MEHLVQPSTKSKNGLKSLRLKKNKKKGQKTILSPIHINSELVPKM